MLGLGEAGGRYAADLLAAGVPVVGFDPAYPPGSGGASAAGPRLAGSAADAVRAAAVVLSLNSASVAERVARDAVPGLRDGTVYADLNTGSPRLKQRIADVVAPTGALFADVAVLAPVPRHGLRTPLAAAGPGRAGLAAFLGGLDVPVDDAGAEPGAAAARKLLRSVFMKGLAAVVLESLEAAAGAGQEDWLREQIVAELTAADGALVDRLVDGTRLHAARRLHEMRDVAEFLAELGTSAPLTSAVAVRLAELAGEPR